jgi:A/G-specific adenine glycosylase
MWANALVDWYVANQRPMPWRQTPSPYHTLISEFMAQQTQISTVIPYFNRWIEQYPTIHDVANASEDNILKSWEGLGYYSRARNLHKTAKIVANENQGNIPKTAKELQSLPGIGPYISAAIASISFNEPIAVVDGNVLRVMTRFFGIFDDIGKDTTKQAIQRRLNQMIQTQSPAHFNQGLMELGALICAPSNPQCTACPLAAMCYAKNMDKCGELPVKKKRQPVPHYTIVVGVIQQENDDRYLITKRKKDQLLGGLWEFPGGKVQPNEDLLQALHREIKEEVNLVIKNAQFLCKVNHAYSHFKITLHAYTCRVKNAHPLQLNSADDAAWVSAEDLSNYAFPKANKVIIPHLL